jgi:hypothetical protein
VRSGLALLFTYFGLGLAGFVLQGGTVVEAGTHQELTARDGLYAQLYQIQLRQEPQASLYDAGAGLRHLN